VPTARLGAGNPPHQRRLTAPSSAGAGLCARGAVWDRRRMLPHLISKHLTYANVASTACIFVLLGGSAYAAVSVTGKDVKNGTITSADIKDHSLRARDFKQSDLPVGPRGPKGDPGRDGAAGAKGEPGTPIAEPPPAARKPAGRLTLTGVTGAGPGGTIQVRSVSWSNTIPAISGGGGGAGKASFGDLFVTKAPDRSSGELWKRTTSGVHMTSAKLELVAPGANAAYATYVFKDVTVKGFSTQGSGDKREEKVRIGFNTTTSPNPVLTFDRNAPLAPLSEPRVGRMTVDGIPGESELVLDAWNLSNLGTLAGGGGAGGALEIGPFVVSKGVSDASPALLQRFRDGAHIKNVTIKLLQPGSETIYSTYVLTDVQITSFSVIGDERPIERMGFDAAKIASVTPVPGDEPITHCYDRKLAVSC
jgi:type VI protein secretion system component Hcp